MSEDEITVELGIIKAKMRKMYDEWAKEQSYSTGLDLQVGAEFPVFGDALVASRTVITRTVSGILPIVDDDEDWDDE